MQAIVIVSGTDPTKEAYVKLYPGKSREMLLSLILEHIKDLADNKDIKKYKKLIQEWIDNKNPDPLKVYNTPYKLDNTPYDLIAIENYSSYDFHYYIASSEVNEDGGYTFTIFEH